MEARQRFCECGNECGMDEQWCRSCLDENALEPQEPKSDINEMNECYSCIHKESVPGNAHIKCAKPDPNMTGNPHGIKNGWFIYPILFDPTWKTAKCNNFEQK